MPIRVDILERSRDDLDEVLWTWMNSQSFEELYLVARSRGKGKSSTNINLVGRPLRDLLGNQVIRSD